MAFLVDSRSLTNTLRFPEKLISTTKSHKMSPHSHVITTAEQIEGVFKESKWAILFVPNKLSTRYSEKILEPGVYLITDTGIIKKFEP